MLLQPMTTSSCTSGTVRFRSAAHRGESSPAFGWCARSSAKRPHALTSAGTLPTARDRQVDRAAGVARPELTSPYAGTSTSVNTTDADVIRFLGVTCVTPRTRDLRKRRERDPTNRGAAAPGQEVTNLVHGRTPRKRSNMPVSPLARGDLETRRGHAGGRLARSAMECGAEPRWSRRNPDLLVSSGSLSKARPATIRGWVYSTSSHRERRVSRTSDSSRVWLVLRQANEYRRRPARWRRTQGWLGRTHRLSGDLTRSFPFVTNPSRRTRSPLSDGIERKSTSVGSHLPDTVTAFRPGCCASGRACC